MMRKILISIVASASILSLLFMAPEVAFAAAYAGVTNFDDLSTGDLNGQAGGSGFTGNWLAYAGLTGITVENSVVYVGTQAITGASGAPNDKISERALTSSVSSGDVYVVLRVANSGAFISFDLRDTTAGNRASQFGVKGGNLFYNDGADHTLAAVSANTWYIFDMNIVDASHWKVRYKADGGSFNSFTADLLYTASVSNPAAVMFETNTASGAVYADMLGTTDPTPPAAPAFNFWQFFTS